jgi:transcriptional regulator with XRE-family HTH domain
MARNQRLHDAIRQSGRRLDDLADEVGADPKTVERWITTGRLPRPATRRKLAEVLGVPESVLWPGAPGVAYGTSELVGIYTTRRELSPATIASLLDAATHHVDVLAYAALWLWDAVPDFAERLAKKVSSGTHVRICLGDPDSDAVGLRGREEGIGDGIANRCRLAANYATVIQRADTDAVRKTGATLYASMLCFDDEVLVNTHFWGNPASDSPVFHFRREGDRGIASTALRSFDRVWEEAQPLSAG